MRPCASSMSIPSGASARSSQLAGSHTLPRRKALAQCMNTSSARTTIAVVGRRSSSLHRSRTRSSVVNHAGPLTRSVSSLPGTTTSSPARPVATIARRLSIRLFPFRSGIATWRSSSTRTKPGGPPGATRRGSRRDRRFRSERTATWRSAPRSRRRGSPSSWRRRAARRSIQLGEAFLAVDDRSDRWWVGHVCLLIIRCDA